MTTPRDLKSFDFAQDTAKQLITLASGTIVLTITFLSDVTGDPDPNGIGWLQVAWLLYLLSIPFGIAVLATLSGNLETEEPSIYRGHIRFFAGGQLVLFLVALLLTVVFGVLAT